MTTNHDPMLTQHARLSTQIDAIDRELSALSADRDQAESERRDAIDRLEQARATAEQPLLRDIRDNEERRRQADRAPDVIEAAAEVTAIEQRIEATNRRDAAAMQRRRALVAERAALSVSLDEIRDLQGRLEQARASVDELQTRLEEARNRPPPERPDLEAFERRYARVLADADMGAATVGDLAAIDKERLTVERAEAKAVKEIQRTERLVRGLSERLSEARARLVELERDHRTLVAGYARSEFEQAARAYHDLAARTFGAHGRLVAMAALVKLHDPELARELGNQYGGLLRFELNIKAANAVDLIDDQAHRTGALESVVEELQGAGIQVRAA
jgi:chromosome segregation ATPase